MRDEITVPRFEQWIEKNPRGVFREWSEREILILKKYWGKVPGKEIAKELGRSYTAMKQKATELGVRARGEK